MMNNIIRNQYNASMDRLGTRTNQQKWLCMKYNIGQVVHYLNDNKHHSAPVISRMFVDNRFNEELHGKQKELFQQFGKSRCCYATIHGVFEEHELFGSKNELADQL